MIWKTWAWTDSHDFKVKTKLLKLMKAHSRLLFLKEKLHFTGKISIVQRGNPGIPAKGLWHKSLIYSDFLHFLQSFHFPNRCLEHGASSQPISWEKAGNLYPYLHVLLQQIFHLDLYFHFYVTENELEEKNFESSDLQELVWEKCLFKFRNTIIYWLTENFKQTLKKTNVLVQDSCWDAYMC